MNTTSDTPTPSHSLRVKPLEWVMDEPDLKASSATGEWMIMKAGGRWTVFRNLQGVSHHASEDEAKNSAHQHHEELVRSEVENV